MEAFKEDYTIPKKYMEKELEVFGHFGAGLAQVWDNALKPSFSSTYAEKYPGASMDSYYDEYGQLQDERLKNAIQTWLQIATYFDVARDFAAIELGYEYNKDKRYHK